MPGPAQPRFGDGGDEEEEALRNERRERRYLAQPGAEGGGPAGAPFDRLAGTAPESRQPGGSTGGAERAGPGRRGRASREQSTGRPSFRRRSSGLLKDEVYRDLLARIRTEFERGG